jgi:hypothetical protein
MTHTFPEPCRLPGSSQWTVLLGPDQERATTRGVGAPWPLPSRPWPRSAPHLTSSRPVLKLPLKGGEAANKVAPPPAGRTPGRLTSDVTAQPKSDKTGPSGATAHPAPVLTLHGPASPASDWLMLHAIAPAPLFSPILNGLNHPGRYPRPRLRESDPSRSRCTTAPALSPSAPLCPASDQ